MPAPEHYDLADLALALESAARRCAVPLSLAAMATVQPEGGLVLFGGMALVAAFVAVGAVLAGLYVVLGRKLQIQTCDTQGNKPETAKACALQLLDQKANILFTTCDVELAAPVVQTAINRGVLAVAPCIGTDQMGPKRFGAKGGTYVEQVIVAALAAAARNGVLISSDGGKTWNATPYVEQPAGVKAIQPSILIHSMPSSLIIVLGAPERAPTPCRRPSVRTPRRSTAATRAA